MNVQERPLGAVSSLSLDPPQTDASLTGLPEQSAAASSPDAITQMRQMAPTWMLQNGNGAAPASGGAQGGLGSIVSQLLNMISELLSMLGLSGTAAGDAAVAPDQYFSNAAGSSVGDPHLAFDGTTPSGQTDTNQFTSQSPQPDLLNSNSFAGGYQVSTQLTQPDGNGNAYNRSAEVRTDGGATRVALRNDGTASVSEDGRRIALQDGQTLNLGNGETVSRANDGAVTITDANSQGGSITTVLRDVGRGVDVSVQARNVQLGGALVGGSPTGESSIPRLRTY